MADHNTGRGPVIHDAHVPLGYYQFPALYADTLVFAAEGDLWRVGAEGGVATRLTSHAGEKSHAAIAPDGKRLAFSASYEGPTEVYTMPLQGGLPTRHTWEGGRAVVGGWTPSGQILYATPAYSTLPALQLLRLDPATNAKTPLPLYQAAEGAFTPDGHTLVFTRLGAQSSHTKRYTGGTVQNLWRFRMGEAEAVPLTTDYRGTSKSPMIWENRVYFLTDRDGHMNLWSMDLDGGSLQQHTFHEGWDAATPSLSEGRIAYKLGADLWLYDRCTDATRPLEIRMPSDFDQLREVWVKKPLDYLTSVALAPQGNRLVLTARGQVFVAPTKQGRLVEVTRQPGVRYRQARFMPDGRTVLALSDASGEVELWRLPANGVGPAEQLTSSGVKLRWEGVPSPDGKWIAHHDKNMRLWLFEVETKQETSIASSTQGNFRDLRWSPEKLEQSKVDLNGWRFAFDPREQLRQMFEEAWRLERDYFYDPNMHGLDWPATREKYRPLAARVTSRSELNDVLAQMISELSALHMFVTGGDVRKGADEVSVASLGADLVPDAEAGGYRVARIYRGDPDNPDESSPLARPDVRLQEGDVLTAINGVETLSGPDIAVLLRDQAGKQLLCRVHPHALGVSRDVIVTPITQAQASSLRYTDWEVSRRQRVEERGHGRLGYGHLRAMGGGNFAEWARDFYPVFHRQGLIIDVRNNTGGNIDSWLLGKLLRQAWFYWQPPVGDTTWNMQYAFRGHLVVLVNAHTASDGEAFAEGCRRLGLGTIIGTRTWGGEIWLSSSNVLVDKGVATAAEFGVFGPEGEWLIEGHGVEPDIVVDNLPHEAFQGRDAQLDTAVEYLLKRIEEEPVAVPPPPSYPNKAMPLQG